MTKTSESSEQIRLFSWLLVTYPEVRAVSFAIPNGGSRNPIEALRLRAEGVTAGIPDVFIAVPRGRYFGLFIEMKLPANKKQDIRKLTSSIKSGEHIRKQRDTLALLAKNGYMAEFCWGFEEAKALIERYLNEKSADMDNLAV